jgi:hypothetical protein
VRATGWLRPTGGRHQVGIAVTLVALLAGREARATVPEKPAAIVALGGLLPERVVDAAAAEVPARWRLETLAPASATASGRVTDLDRLERAYLEADFLRCLSEMERASVRVDGLLEHGRRADAGRAGTLAAACALGAGDEARAREMLRRLHVRGLVEPGAVRRTTPEFQRIVEEERSATLRRPRVAIDVHTKPAAAEVRVDGVVQCVASPCRVHVTHGEHMVVAEKLGHRARSVSAMLDGDKTLTIDLDAASADEVRLQLAAALDAGADPSRADIPRAAAASLGVSLLVLTWKQKGQVHALVYRHGEEPTHVALADGPHAAARAVAAGLREWRGEPAGKPSRSLLREPLFWATAAGAALLSAGATFFIIHPSEARR